jgi:site-specific recombinase XerD
VQGWVTHAVEGGLSARSVRKYHTLLHGIFARAVRDRLILSNPAAHTELPKVINQRRRILTPDEFDTLVANVPAEHRLIRRRRRPQTVMDRLGHSQLSTTQQYLHTLPNTDDTAPTALARIRGRPAASSR